jgi:predicted GIY-YIG superfamily endonuclease
MNIRYKSYTVKMASNTQDETRIWNRFEDIFETEVSYKHIFTIDMIKINFQLLKTENDMNLNEHLSSVHFCYLLESKAKKGKYYIGYTKNPKRRLDQHNGMIPGGAARTKNGRPWEIVLEIHGFKCETSALRFEFHWQKSVNLAAIEETVSKPDITHYIRTLQLVLEMSPFDSLSLHILWQSAQRSEELKLLLSIKSQLLIKTVEVESTPNNVNDCDKSIPELYSHGVLKVYYNWVNELPVDINEVQAIFT